MTKPFHCLKNISNASYLCELFDGFILADFPCTVNKKQALQQSNAGFCPCRIQQTHVVFLPDFIYNGIIYEKNQNSSGVRGVENGQKNSSVFDCDSGVPPASCFQSSSGVIFTDPIREELQSLHWSYRQPFYRSDQLS